MKNRLQELNLLKKEVDSDFSIFWPHFCNCIKSPLTKLQFFMNEQNYCSEIFRKLILIL